MPYDEDGNYTSNATRDEYGFYNQVAPPAPPNDGGPMTAVDAGALIQKQIG